MTTDEGPKHKHTLVQPPADRVNPPQVSDTGSVGEEESSLSALIPRPPEAAPNRADQARPTDNGAALSASPVADSSNDEPRNAVRERAPRPRTVLEFLDHAYAKAGNKLEVVQKDLQQLKLDPDAAASEMEALLRHAKEDTFLAVPPIILATLAELDAPTPVKKRILDLVRFALGSHPVFKAHARELDDPHSDPPLTAHLVSESARKLTFSQLHFEKPSDYKDASRQRLHVNAVVSFELFRIVRDGWPFDRFVQDMTELVWTAPDQTTPGKKAAVLLSNRTTDALSQLANHCRRVTADANSQLASALLDVRAQQRRAEDSEAAARQLRAQWQAERERASQLEEHADALNRRLQAEQSRRVVDQSHHADDYEALRTHVIRRFSPQVNLLTDGLHALRNGRTEVAEEFLDRALLAIGGEVARLREMSEEDQ